MSTRSLVDGTANFRDVAASPGASPRLKPGVFYRSDAFSSVTDRGREQFQRLGVGLVVDLRAHEEAALAPDLLPSDAVTLSVPLLQGRQDAPTGLDLGELPALGQLYASMLENNAADLLKIAESVAETPGPTVVHCAAGKDRTGVSTALILAAVGVDRETIVADYAITESRLAGPWEHAQLRRLADHKIKVTPAMKELLLSSPPEAMEATLGVLQETFGGAEAYLRDAGLSAKQFTTLKGKLLA